MNMYSEYSTFPVNRYQTSSNVSSYSSSPVSSSMPVSSNYYSNDDRIIGGFAFPFLLGGVTGAALAPAFWRPAYQPYPRPYPGPYYPGPYPYYRPF